MRVAAVVLSAVLSWSATAAQAADAVVEVRFAPKQGRFIDAGETARDRARTETELTKQLQGLGARFLPAGAMLKIVVTEVDLAGRVPMGRIDLPRVMNGGADWPRIAFTFELMRPDGSADRGEAEVSDMSYLMRPQTVRHDEPLSYERRMLEDWFRARVEPAASAAPG